MAESLDQPPDAGTADIWTARRPGGEVTAPSAVLSRSSVATRWFGFFPQLLVALVCAGYGIGSAVGWGAPTVASVMGDFGLSAAAMCASVSCFCYACTVSCRSRPAWVLFAASSSMVAAGNGVWGWYEVVLRQPVPSTSLADFCFVLFAPPAIIGVLVLAKRPCSRLGWVCLVLDSWLIAGSLVTLSWSLALAHSTHGASAGSLPRAALSLAYPLLDIALISMVLALHFRRSSANGAAVNAALAALALTVMCDALFTAPMLRDSYRSGQILDAGWFAGSMLLAYAPWASLRQELAATDRRPQPPRRVAGSLTALTPYVSAAICTLGILYNVLDGRTVDRFVLITGGMVVLALVTRQGIMLLDNMALAQELAEQENHFRSLVQGSSDVIMIAAPSGVLRYVSPASRGVYGRAAEELIGTDLAALVHPDDVGQVLCEVSRFLAAPASDVPSTRIECRIGSGRGTWLNVESTVNRYADGLIFNSRDVTERVRLQAQLEHNASHDPLTDLPNRALYTERVRQALGGRRAGDGHAAILFIDLDGFKAVNDSAGHPAGDELLVHAARRLQESVRSGDTVARFGGDEFAALVRGGSDDREVRETQAREVADRLRTTLSQPYWVGGMEVKVGASIGIAFAEPGITSGELMRNADLAMYRAKSRGKGCVEVYVPQLKADAVRRTELASRLRVALDEGEFTLLHQPVVDLATGEVALVEAQARWRSPQGVLFSPAEFLRLAERVDHTAELGHSMLATAIEQAAQRHRAGLPAPVAVRLCANRLLEESLPEQRIEALLTSHGLPASGLIVMLGEHGPADSLDDLERRLVSLKRLGVRIALDCFGGGHGALTALGQLPVDMVRIDKKFVHAVVDSPRMRKLTAGMLAMSADLNLLTIGDGIDAPEQALMLRSLGCTHGQGGLFAGLLDEPRLAAALTHGSYSVPHSSPRVTPTALSSAPAQVHPPLCPNSETSIPPT